MRRSIRSDGVKRGRRDNDSEAVSLVSYAIPTAPPTDGVQYAVENVLSENFDWMKYKSKQQAVEHIQCLSCSQRWNINEENRRSLASRTVSGVVDIEFFIFVACACRLTFVYQASGCESENYKINIFLRLGRKLWNIYYPRGGTIKFIAGDALTWSRAFSFFIVHCDFCEWTALFQLHIIATRRHTHAGYRSLARASCRSGKDN